MNKYLKLANYFDSKGLYKSADSLDLFVKKAQGLSFIEKQPDLAKIEKSNKIANDIVYYAASVSQGTRTPSYDPKSFFTTIQKIESMKNNPDVQTNFPNIYNSLDAAKELLTKKSVGQTPGEQTPGENPESAPLNPQNPNTPSDAKKEDIEFVRKTYEDMKRFAEYDIPRHQRDLELLDPEKEQDKIRKKKQIINNYLALIDKAKLTLSNPKYKKAVDELIKRGELPSEVTSEGPILPKSGNSRSDAGKILDEAFPTYSSRDPKPDQRLPGLDGTGVGRELDKVRINYDYMQKFPPMRAGLNETDPAGGPKLTPEQLSIYGVDPKDILVSR